MAIYSFQCKIIGKGQKNSGGVVSVRGAVASAAYRAGEKLRSVAEGVMYDFTRKQGVIHSEILLPQGAPAKYHDRQTLWNEVEAREKRKDSQYCREVVIALPAELSREDNIKLARKYVQRHFVDKGMCADISFHDPDPKSGEQRNPHIHVMLTQRDIIAGRFGNKNRDWNIIAELKDWRELWAVTCNSYLEQLGIAARIDHRSLKEQGVDRTPTVHMGHKATALERRNIRTEKGNLNRSIRAGNAARDCGIEAPSILANVQRLWQKAAEQRRSNEAANATLSAGVDRRRGGAWADSRCDDVQRRTYTLQSNVVRQGSDPAPDRGKESAQLGGGVQEKRPQPRGQKASPSGAALRQPAPRAASAMYNIKVMSTANSFMSEHGIGSYDELERKLAAVTSTTSAAEQKMNAANRLLGIARAGVTSKAEANALRAKLARAEQLHGAALRCQANRAEWEQYNKTIFKENYYKKFGHKIDAYQRAAELLRAAGLDEKMNPEQLRQPAESMKAELKKQTGKYQWAVDELKAAGIGGELEQAVANLTDQSRELWQKLGAHRRELGHWQRIREQVDNVLAGRDAKQPAPRVSVDEKKNPRR